MRLAGLYIYPVKSLAGMSVERVRLSRRGLEGDRRWMIVDRDGVFVTQREEPLLGTLSARLHPGVGGGVLEIVTAGSSLRLPAAPDHGKRRVVRVWKDHCEALVSVEGSQLVSDRLGRAVELVFMPDDVERKVPYDGALAGEVVSFADGFPLLLVGQGSLDGLNARLLSALPMTRFRPNLVVDSVVAHAEDGWGAFTIGRVAMRMATPCARCSITTVDDAGLRGKEPLTTLASYRRGESLGYEAGGVYFGMNVIHDHPGELMLGDEVVVSGRLGDAA